MTDSVSDGIPAADDRDAGRLLRADLVDRGDEAGQVEVGRPGDDDLDAELLGDLLHADIVVLHEQRQVRLVGDPVVGLLRVGRAEGRFLRRRPRADAARGSERRAGKTVLTIDFMSVSSCMSSDSQSCVSSGCPDASCWPRLHQARPLLLKRSSETANSSTRPTTSPCQNTPIAVDDHGVLDQRDEQDAEDAAEDRALAALQAGAAEHGRGDDLELDADAGVDHGAVQARRAQHAGKAGQRAHDDEADQGQPVDADAGELGRARHCRR